MARVESREAEEQASEAPQQRRYALVLKTYVWDSFVERQVRRMSQKVSQGDFFVWIDESHAPAKHLVHKNVVRTTSKKMIADGWSGRFEKGSLFWWNADYPHYDFFSHYADYQLYVFVEYDALMLGDIDLLVEQIRERNLDFVALPLREPMQEWAWTPGHLRTYSREELLGCLMCVSVFSKRALQMLSTRRRAMARDSTIPFWPSAEAFLPTEIARAGFHSASLEEFADLTQFDWRPPHLEEDVIERTGPALIHPVYDRRRYVRWAIEAGPTLRLLFDREGVARSSLARLPRHVYFLPWLIAVVRALGSSAHHRLQRRYG